MSWGFNKYGQLGLGHKDDVSTATEIPALEGHKVCGIWKKFGREKKRNKE
jgi:hypothetical protein